MCAATLTISSPTILRLGAHRDDKFKPSLPGCGLLLQILETLWTFGGVGRIITEDERRFDSLEPAATDEGPSWTSMTCRDSTVRCKISAGNGKRARHRLSKAHGAA